VTAGSTFPDDPDGFALEWAETWNARDIEGALAHFSDDAVFSSPIARSMGHGVNGVVSGKAAIREYWKAALALNPELKFTVRSVHSGVNAIVIGFETQDGTRRSEVLIFEDGLIRTGYGTTATRAE
jgi:ketosteroid isomerase-like protein